MPLYVKNRNGGDRGDGTANACGRSISKRRITIITSVCIAMVILTAFMLWESNYQVTHVAKTTFVRTENIVAVSSNDDADDADAAIAPAVCSVVEAFDDSWFLEKFITRSSS